MSNRSTATVVTAPADIIGDATASVIGAGMLIAEGLMWCGRKMIQNYEDASQSFSNLAISELEAQRARKEDRRQHLNTMIEQFSASRLQDFSVQSQTESAALQQQEQAAIADLLKRAQQAQKSAEQAQLLKMEQELAQWQRTLREELAASEAIVPLTNIVTARTALQGSVQEIQSAYQELQQAREQALQKTTDTVLLRTHKEQQVRHLLEQVEKELDVTYHMLKQSYAEIDQRFADQVRGMRHLLQEARERADNTKTGSYDPERALRDVQLARRDLQRFKEQVTVILTDTLDQREQQRIEARGRLTALSELLEQAQQGKIIAARSGHELLQRVKEWHADLERVDISQADGVLQQQIERIEPLAQRVFREIGEGQQKVVADVVAETLGELGYYDDLEAQLPPTISMSGPGMKILAKRAVVDGDGAKQERVVTFTVERDGGVSYDFSGYVGAECLQAGNEVFAALKKKGITILDYADAKRLEDAPAGLTPQMLVQSPLAPHMTVNKDQALLAEKILDIVYHKMNFSKVFQSASDGAIIIEALGDDIGYHITLTSDGVTGLLCNGQELSPDNGSDLLVLHLSTAMQEVSTESKSALPAPQQQGPKSSQEQRYYEQQQGQQLSQ